MTQMDGGGVGHRPCGCKEKIKRKVFTYVSGWQLTQAVDADRRVVVVVLSKL